MSEDATNNTISFEEFSKVKLVVGKIVEAESIPGYKKLLKLKVDVGDGIRDILSGIAIYYSPEELIGKRVIICINLNPKRIGTLISQGMILAAEGDDGKPILITTSEDVRPGSKIE